MLSFVPRFIVARWYSLVIAIVALLIGGAIAGAVGEAERDPSVDDTLPAGAASTKVSLLQAEYAPTEDAGGVTPAIVLWAADDGQLTDSQIADATAATVAQLTTSGDSGSAPGGPPGSGGGGAPASGPLRVAEDGTAALAVVPLQSETATQLGDKVEALRMALREAAPDGVTVQVTGPAGIRADLAAVFQGANFRLLFTTVGVVTLLLLVTYRSPILWIIPLLCVLVADRLSVTAATHGLKAVGVPWDESTVGILSVLVFGAGTNYALLLISRYRDELRTTEDRYEAMRTSLLRAGEAVVSSASTVVVGVLTLLLSAFPATRGLGLASAIGIGVAAVFVLVVLPCMLVVFGRWIFWPLIPRVGQAQLVNNTSIWRRIGTAVADNPRRAALGVVILLAVLASGTLGIRTGLSQEDQFLQKPEAISASERLSESFPAGSSEPTVVLTTADPNVLAKRSLVVDGVSSASVEDTVGPFKRVDVVLSPAPGSDAALIAVDDLRDALDGFGDTWVGGTDAQQLDTERASTRDLALIVPLILLLVIGVLGFLLRSVVAPILLVATVVGTYAAAMGISWVVFTGVFGFSGLGTSTALFAFLFLVALGVDYNIFLVTRIAEERATFGVRKAVIRGLSATGGVITSAGILLAAVFAVLGVLPLVVLAQLGTVICIGVLLDTLVVRTVLVPALAVALGDAFWWPRSFSKTIELSELEKSQSTVEDTSR